jgi:hypothetical protein
MSPKQQFKKWGEGKISELNEQMESSSSSFGKNDPVWLDCLVKKKTRK